MPHDDEKEKPDGDDLFSRHAHAWHEPLLARPHV